MKKMRVLALVTLLLLASAADLRAEGFGLYEWSARGIALGGATMARRPDPSVISSNPAAMTGLPGAQVQAGVSLVMPYGEVEFRDSGRTYKIKDKTWLVPNMYYTQQVNDRLFLGVGEFSRFGLGFEYPGNWDGRYNIYDVSVVTSSVNPNVAYKLTNELSLAVGVEVMYADITLKKKVDGTGGGAPGAADIDFDTSTTNWEYTWNVAMHYQFNEQWAFGAGYRHYLKHNIDGKLKVNPQVPAAGIVNQDFTATVYMPDSASFGLAFTPTPRLSFEAGAVWTHWSRFTDLDFDFDRLGMRENKKYWKNTWRLNIGVEYALTDWMDVRAGYLWDQCPVRESREDYLIPTNNRNIWSVGLGFTPGDWTIDLAYAFVDPTERHYQARAGSGVESSKTKNSGSNIVSVSLGYKF